MTATTAPHPAPVEYYVAACGARKLDVAAPARELYTGSARLAIDTAVAEAARAGGVALILSARHGLVALDAVLEPYDQRMDAPGAISVAALAAQVAELPGNAAGAVFYAFLPGAYRRALEAAVELVCDAADDDLATVQDVFEGNRGIGDQRGIVASVERTAALFD